MSTELKQLYKAQKIKNPWAIAWALISGNGKGKHFDAVRELHMDEINAAKTGEQKRSLAGRLVAGMENNPYNKSMDDPQDFVDLFKEEEEKIEKRISPAAAALAGWWLSDNVTRGMGQPTPAQQREFERQIQQAMRKKGRRLNKESALEKMKAFFKNSSDSSDTYVRKTPVANAVKADDTTTDILKVLSMPPFQGARFDPTSHRWVKPENVGNTYAARGGKKRIRGSGTGAHQRSVSGHGKGRIRGEGAGRHKSAIDLATSRKKEGLTHGSSKKRAKQRKDQKGYKHGN